MERTDKIRWRKTGGGFFRLASGKIIKPNQVFLARLDEIPEEFRDVIKPLNKEELKSIEEGETIEIPKLQYTVRHLGGGWYNVVDSNGKVVNEKKVRKAEAEELVSSLT